MSEVVPAGSSADDAIQFVLNGEPRTVCGIVPHISLLEYLRDHEQCKGSKEGCGEGDCGACTVLVLDLDVDGRPRLRSAVSCLTLLPAVDGAAIYTVDGLEDGELLHPVQQALVESHGSQCGFCTPGIVMSMLALFKRTAAPTRAQIDDALSGNLCRCTGYRPIIEAAAGMHRHARRDGRGDGERGWLAQAGWDGAGAPPPAVLAKLPRRGRGRALRLEAGGRRWMAPAALGELNALLAGEPDAVLVAGGTDAATWRALQAPSPVLVHLLRVAELQVLDAGRDGFRIGAAVSIDAACRVLEQDYPALGSLRRRFGGPQVRAAATLGGNLASASPVADAIPALLALDAEVSLQRGAEVRTVPLASFVTGRRSTVLRPGEFIRSIHVPRAMARPDHLRFYKVSKRFDQDIATVSGCFRVRIDGGVVTEARAAFGGVGPVPLRAQAAESELTGRPWTRETIEQAAAALEPAIAPASDVRAGSAYRTELAANLLRRFWLETTAGGAPLTVWDVGSAAR